MKEIRTALYEKMAGSAFATSIGSRLRDGRVPQNFAWPYVAYFFVTSVPGPVFVEDMNDMTVQFSIFSAASATTEILDIGENLIALYDGCTLSADGWGQVFMQYANGRGVVTDYPKDMVTGTGAFYQCDIDFNLIAVK